MKISLFSRLKRPYPKALRFVFIIGVVSLFADITYEGARSITGPFLAVLGAPAVLVGFVAGLGELIGYTLRFVTGYWVDKTAKHWTLMFVGYFCNLLAVPLLALANTAWAASALIIIERIGKGIRIPARDAMLSYAGHHVGMGRAFGIHEAMDKLGATLGPLLVALVLFWTNHYRVSFALLLIPAALALFALGRAYQQFPHPHDLDSQYQPVRLRPFQHKTFFWVFVLGAGFLGAGYADYALIAYHIEKKEIFSMAWIPVLYALMMGVNSLASPFLGRLYDRYGFRVLLLMLPFSLFSMPLLFLGTPAMIVLGAIFWGLGMSSLGSVMLAAVAQMVAPSHRGSAYGIFNVVFGLFWFLGSVIMGFLYDYSVPALVVFSMALQTAALPCFWKVKRALPL